MELALDGEDRECHNRQKEEVQDFVQSVVVVAAVG